MKRQYLAVVMGWLTLLAGTAYADGLEMLIIKNQHDNAPVDYSVMVRASEVQPFTFGLITLPGGGNQPMMVQDGELVFMQVFPDMGTLNAAGWTNGLYTVGGYFSSGSTNYTANIPGFNEYSFPYTSSVNLAFESRRSITPDFEINGEWSWFGITNSAGEEVFGFENTNNSWMVSVDEAHALDYETPYTAIALTIWPWSNPYLGAASSLEFTTGFIDMDADGLPDTWEQQIIDHNTNDFIVSIEDVLIRDDYDLDNFSNQAEYAGDLDPTVADTGVYNSLSNGFSVFADLFSSEEIYAGKIELIDHCFSGAVAADPNDYEARFFRACSRLLNLMNNQTLHSILDQFGISLNAFLEPTEEEVSLLSMPGINSIMDSGVGELLPAIEASLADLSVIPSNWTGSIQISTNDFPLDTDVYLDLADIMFAKSALSMFAGVVRTAKANSFDLDYDLLQLPMSGPVASITIDGNTNDWASVPVQLYGEQYSQISSVRAARDASSLYLLVEARKPVFDDEFQINGDLLIGQDQYAWISLDGTNSWIGYESAGITTSGVNNVASGKILELAIPVPVGVTVSNICVEGLSLNVFREYMWQSDYVSAIDNTPAEVLLANHPSFLQSIRSSDDLLTAKTNLSDAIDFFFTADALASNRTDELMHFVEYDPTNAPERAEINTRIQEIQASLAAPVQYMVTNQLGEVEFNEQIHLGAYFNPAYLTRAMLPEFHRVLGQPSYGTFPDPTFGGILPGLAQTNLNAWMEDAIDDVDYDYLPNWWENLYSNTVTGVSAEGDEDHDGLNNLQEYTGGSNPTDPSSVFVLRGISPTNDFSGDGIDIWWDALPGRTYSLWKSTSLEGEFELFMRDSSGSGHFQDMDNSTNAFYRIEVELD